MNKEEKNFFEKLTGISNSPMDDISEEESQEEEFDEEKDEKESEEYEGQLVVDVYQTNNNFVIISAIAGVEPENIDISITSESITIKAKREKEERIRTENYLLQECFWGSFTRSIVLPQEVDPERAQAIFKNGILKIVLPKINRTKTKKIKVKFE